MVEFRYSCKAIDDLVGTVKPGVLLEFYGYSATGKTTLAAHLPIAEIAGQNELPDNGVFVVFDVDEGFSYVRLRQILEKRGLDADAVTGRIWYYHPTSFKEQHEAARKLSKRLKDKKKVPLLIVNDAMPAIYRQIILTTDMQHRAAVTGLYTGKLNLQINDMRRIAVKYECPLIVTTWKISPLGDAMGSAKPEFDGIGGRGFFYLPKIIIRLEAPGGVEKQGRIAVIAKHREKKSGQVGRFELCDEGVRDA